jgi:hypothetical protein
VVRDLSRVERDCLREWRVGVCCLSLAVGSSVESCWSFGGVNIDDDDDDDDDEGSRRESEDSRAN